MTPFNTFACLLFVSFSTAGIPDTPKRRSSTYPDYVAGDVRRGRNSEGWTGGEATGEGRDLMGYNWLPKGVVNAYYERGVKIMYPWQAQAMDAISRSRSNMVLTLPTSAGKTFSAEIAMLHCCLTRNKTALLVVPYVALVVEKLAALSRVAKQADLYVAGYHGPHGRLPPLRRPGILIATPEKATAIVNSLITTANRSILDIGLAVLDELHMVGEWNDQGNSRGPTLELLASLLSWHHSGGLQVIGMSATLANAQEMANWLNGYVFSAGFRPVPLKQFVKAGVDVYNATGARIRTLRGLGGESRDSMGVMDLVREVTTGKGGVLIFCSSRVAAESCAEMIASHGGADPPEVPDAKMETRDTQTQERSFERLKDIRGDLATTLVEAEEGLDSIFLREIIKKGVAFHHAGLGAVSRALIEDGYRRGIIRILCATSTLAAGVNLPARRVIFRTPYVGGRFLDVQRYRQMSGRAGRAGLDEAGDSFLLVRPASRDLNKALQLMKKPLTGIRSGLMAGPGIACENPGIRGDEDREGLGKSPGFSAAAGVLQAVLIAVTALGTTTHNQLTRFMNHTLLAAQVPPSVLETQTQKALTWLSLEGFLATSTEPDGDSIRSGKMAWAAFKAAVSPWLAVHILRDLRRASMSLVVSDRGCLHLCYLCAQPGDIRANYTILQSILTKATGTQLGTKPGTQPGEQLGVPKELEGMGEDLETHGDLNSGDPAESRDWPASVASIAEAVGLNLEFVRSQVKGRTYGTKAQSLHQIASRFYCALMLAEAVQEADPSDIARSFHVSTGDIQMIMQSASSNGVRMWRFCEEMSDEFWHIGVLLKAFVPRIYGGVRREIAELTLIPYLGGARARKAFDAGLKSIRDIATCRLRKLSAILQIGLVIAHRIKTAAQALVQQEEQSVAEALERLRAESGTDVSKLLIPNDAQEMDSEGVFA